VELESQLKKYFGYDTFRGNQKEVIQSVLKRKDTFVIMPTGAGKSLCYQLPAVILEGIAIVISPLIALMKNQVDQLNAYGIAAEYLNSTLNKTDTTRIKNEAVEGKIKLLYVAPESLTKEENVVFFKKLKISFVAVDEVHCISEWGHDFRPEYRKIRIIIDNISSKIPIIALTATATPKVQQDIIKNLQLDKAQVFKSSFFRNNLFYEVFPKVNIKKSLIQFLTSRKDQCGIIYCLSRKKVEELTEFLVLNGYNALPYHAGLDNNVRMHNQDSFLHEETKIIVATIAFGMGIDKPNVRFVIHYDAPKSLEGYYQETGRAGRDSMQSTCLLYYSYSDIVKLEKFNKDKSVSERENGKVLLEEVAAYSEAGTCRTKLLLSYFGEYLEQDCGNCDNCKNPKEQFEGKDYLLKILLMVRKTGEKFTFTHIVNILCGIKTDEITGYEHDKLAFFGIYADQDLAFITSIARQAIVGGFLAKDIDHIGVVKLTEKGQEFIAYPEKIKFYKNHEFPEIDDELAETSVSSEDRVLDQGLFKILLQLRKDVAKKKNVPPYVVFHEETMQEMCMIYPTTLESLAHINGVGIGKARKFGTDFVNVIKKYIQDNDIEPTSELYIKTSANKSKNKIHIIQMIDNKVNLEDLAHDLGLNFIDVLTEMEHICHAGTKINIDYYLEEIMDDDKIDDIYDYYMTAESDDMELALEELGEDYTEEEIRLVHIKFISEVAN